MTLPRTWLAGWRPYLLLAALCLCLYLPGQRAIPVLDRDEARFAQATRQMLESGDFLRIRFRDEARNNKPAGIYWLQAASVAALSTANSTAIWPYRLPSLCGALLAVLLTYALGRRLWRGPPDADADAAPRTALSAAVLLAAALGLVAEAHIAKTDAALLAATVAGQGSLGLCYVRARGGGRVGAGIAAAFWLAEIAAILLKGPIAPGLALLAATVLSIADRDARWLSGLRPLAGIAAAILAIAPWLYAIEDATEGQFLAGSVGHDFLSKIFGAQEAHGAPPLYYLVVTVLTFWPGSLLLAPALIRGWRRREQPIYRFLMAWIVPAWVVLELVPTKLPHYALPLYPALALLAAGALISGGATERPWPRRVDLAVRGLWLLATLALAAMLVIAPLRFGAGLSPVGVIGAAALVILAAASLFIRPGPAGTTALLAALALAWVVPATGWVVPGLDRLWLSREAAAMLARHPPDFGRPLAVIGYNEPSLVFLLRNRFEAGSGATLAAGGEALVNRRQKAVFEQTLATRNLSAVPIDSVAGTDYSNGQRSVLTLYRVGLN